MPIVHQGYEPYRGPTNSRRPRPLAIARVAIRRNLRWWTWVLTVFGLLVGSAFGFFVVLIVYGVATLFPGAGGGPGPAMNALVNRPDFYIDAIFYRQTFWAIVLGTVVGAGEIAEDLRTGALVFYLGRPVTRLEYMLGKALAVAIPVLAVTALPSTVIFTMHALFEGSWGWLGEHWRVLPAAWALGLAQCVFVAGLVLGVSSVVRRRRWATVSIAGIYFVLFLAALILAPDSGMMAGRERHRLERRARAAATPAEANALFDQLDATYNPLGSPGPVPGVRFLSPTASVRAAGRDLLGLEVPENFSWGRHWLLLLGLGGLGFVVLHRRVRAVEVVA